MHLLFSKGFRLMLTLALAAMLSSHPPVGVNQLIGTWKITAMVENGRSLSQREIMLTFSAEGQITVN